MAEDREFQEGVRSLMGQGVQGNAKLIDAYLHQPKDFNDENFSDLRLYQYAMEGLTDERDKVLVVDVMVKRGKAVSGCITAESYDLISKVQHEVLLPLENYVPLGNGWVVVPPVDGTLKGFMDTRGNAMFQGNGAKKEMSPYLHDMIIDLTSLRVKLSMKVLCPRVTINDLFIKMVDNVPKLRVLITQVVAMEKADDNFCDLIKAMVVDCCKRANVEFSDASKSFLNFIYNEQCIECVPFLLRSYPDNWTSTDKQHYLLSMFSSQIPWKDL